MQIRCKFGQLGPGKGQFNSPHGFCLGLEEEIIVADTNNHRIQVTFPACMAHSQDWIHLPMQLRCSRKTELSAISLVFLARRKDSFGIHAR